jgi:hypothetical protein
MVRSLGLVLGVAVLVTLLGPARTLLLDHSQTFQPVTFREDVIDAQRWSGHQVLAPIGLSATWRVTSARIEVGARGSFVLHIGYYTPMHRYASLIESDDPPGMFVATQLGASAQRAGSAPVGSETWTRWRTSAGPSLVRRDGRLTVVLTGGAPLAELARLAAALRLT